MLHKNAITGDIHYLQNWSVVDTTARDALTVSTSDVGKVCQVTGTSAYYILTDDSPMTWQVIGSGSGTVTSVTSANADATVATTTTTPVITIVQAPALRSATTTVNVASATAPTSGQVLTATSGTAATWQTPAAGGGGITLGTPQNSTSGTSIDFTSIPSGVKSITIMLSAVSTNGATGFIVQLGDAGGVETTGYTSTGFAIQEGVAAGGGINTSGFEIYEASGAGYSVSGHVFLTLQNSSTNTWIASLSCNYPVNETTAVIFLGSGTKSLSAELDRVRITTNNGTDTFDAGVINIQYQS